MIKTWRATRFCGSDEKITTHNSLTASAAAREIERDYGWKPSRLVAWSDDEKKSKTTLIPRHYTPPPQPSQTLAQVRKHKGNTIITLSIGKR